MICRWSLYVLTLLLTTVSSVLLAVGQQDPECASILYDARYDVHNCSSYRQLSDVCKQQAQENSCPDGAALNTHLHNYPKGCNSEDLPLDYRRNTTTSSNLTFSLSSYGRHWYNFTVHWEHLHLGAPINSSYELKLFRFSNQNNPDLLSFLRQVCSVQETGHLATADSFDALCIKRNNVFLVELTIFYPNKSVFVVMATRFEGPDSCLDIKPTALQCCMTDDVQRLQGVLNLTHRLIQNGSFYVMELSWEQSVFSARYMLPVDYYITVNASGHSNSVFIANTTSISLLLLQPTSEYSVEVRPFIAYSSDCGEGVCQEVLARPSSAPSNVTAQHLNGNRSCVSWNEIPEFERNGIIVIYEVWHETDHVLISQSYSNTTDLDLCITLYLMPSAFCNISVRGYTSVGPGPFSEPFVLVAPTSPPHDNGSNHTTPRTATPIAMVTVVSTSAAAAVVAIGALVVAVSAFLIVKCRRFKSSNLSSIVIPQSVSLTTTTHATNHYYKQSPAKFRINESVLLEQSLGAASDSSRDTADDSDTSRDMPDDIPVYRSVKMEHLPVKQANSTFIPTNPVRQLVRPIVVLSQYTPELDKSKILNCLLMKLKLCRSVTSNRMMAPTHPDIDEQAVRQSGSEWLWNEISSYDDTSETPCFLCVVNRELKDDWRNVSTSDNHSLVYALSRYIVGMSMSNDNINKQVILIFLNGIDKTLVPTPLKECLSSDVTDLKKIASLVFKEPAIVLSDCL